jgi:HEPN domain-containing protein/rRNA maturation protein Nop10
MKKTTAPPYAAPDITATLLDSAEEFLVEAFANNRAHKRNFAIVHAVTAVELVLKESLSRIHPNLIFEDIDKLTKKTVSLHDLPRRLLNFGVKVKPNEVRLIRQCAEWRNQIVHHLPDFDPKEAEIKFQKLLDFIAAFMRRVLKKPIEDVLPTRWHKTAKHILKDWKHAIAEAQKRAAKQGNVLSDVCPECGGDKVLSVRDENKVHCHLCRSDDYKYQKCPRCGRQTVTTSDWWCDKCLNEIAEDVAVTRTAPPAYQPAAKELAHWIKNIPFFPNPDS